MPLTLAQLVAVGTDVLVARRLELGESITDIRLALARLFPEASQQTIYAAYFHGQTTYGQGQEFATFTGKERFRAGDILPPLGGNLGWKYGVKLSFGTADDGVQDVRYMLIDYGRSATADEVARDIEDRAREYLTQERVGRSPGVRDRQSELLDYTIFMVSRY